MVVFDQNFCMQRNTAVVVGPFITPIGPRSAHVATETSGNAVGIIYTKTRITSARYGKLLVVSFPLDPISHATL